MTLPVFPTLKGVTFPVKRAPKLATLHQPSISGMDNPIPLWTFPQWSYELTYSFLRSDSVNLEWQALAAFFLSVGGSARVFQFADPDDGAVTDQGFGVGDGVTRAFPLVRTLTGFGGYTFVEPVFSPTITTLKVNGLPTAAYVLGTSGLVTMNVAPAAAAVLTWTGTYTWLCRFDSDAAEFEKFAFGFFELKKIAFTTIKTQSK